MPRVKNPVFKFSQEIPINMVHLNAGEFIQISVPKQGAENEWTIFELIVHHDGSFDLYGTDPQIPIKSFDDYKVREDER